MKYDVFIFIVHIQILIETVYFLSEKTDSNIISKDYMYTKYIINSFPEIQDHTHH